MNIEGYWLDTQIDDIPDDSGVYFVYEGTFDEVLNIDSIHKLIYIGESAWVRDRIMKHERYDDWKKHVRPGNTLCYSFGPVSDHYRRRVEAAYIFRHKPPENDEYRDIFPFDQTTINSSGATDLLDPSFKVYLT